MCTVTDLDFDFVLWRLVQFTVCVVSALQHDALQQWCKGHSLLAQTVYNVIKLLLLSLC